MLYFAYGSNMSLEQMNARITEEGGAFRVVGRAVLKDYELRFSKASAREAPVGFANVVKKPGSVVEGILYEVDEKGMSLLDAFEGVPDRHYQREILPVETPGGLKAEACVYVACPERVREGLKPAGSYLALLLEGRAFLSQEYVRWLEAQPVQEGDQRGGSDDPS